MFWDVIDLACMLGELLSATGHTGRGFLKSFHCVNSWNVCLQLLLVLEILYDKVGVNYVRKFCCNTVSGKRWKKLVESFIGHKNLGDN